MLVRYRKLFNITFLFLAFFMYSSAKEISVFIIVFQRHTYAVLECETQNVDFQVKTSLFILL